MDLASYATTSIITPEEPNSNLTNSPITPNATLAGSNKSINTETLFPCNCRSAGLNINSSKNNILEVEARLSALKSYVNCKLTILRSQIESFTKHTKMLLGHENRNIDAVHKNIAFLQIESTEKSKMIKSLMETQTAVLDVMTDL